MALGSMELLIVLAVVAILAVVVITALAVVFFVTKVMVPRSKERREADRSKESGEV